MSLTKTQYSVILFSILNNVLAKSRISKTISCNLCIYNFAAEANKRLSINQSINLSARGRCA